MVVVTNIYVNILKILTIRNMFSLKLTEEVDWYKKPHFCTIQHFILIKTPKKEN